MVYKKLLNIATRSKRSLDPSRYTSDLFEEQNGPNPPVSRQLLSRLSTTASTSMVASTSGSLVSQPGSRERDAPSSGNSTVRVLQKNAWGPVDLGPWQNEPETAEDTSSKSRDHHEAESTSLSVNSQHLRAYTLWRHGDALIDICASFSTKDNLVKKGIIM